ncbi:PDZ domain-containing protein [Candidatus Falkowbacteria bacterium]|nr:PDZ domain-containing protein [Candidatus Falkowbacteria bacterium]
MELFQKKDNSKSIRRRISSFIFVLVLMLIAFSLGLYISGTDNEQDADQPSLLSSIMRTSGSLDRDKITDNKKNIDLELYWDLWDTLKEEYVDKGGVNDNDLFYGSLKGMAESLDDPYTIFMDPEDSQEFEEGLSGTFQGIGCEVGMRDDILTVIAPLDGSPAEKAGLMPGDKIMAVDGEPTINMNIDEAVKKIRGEKGTIVKLTIYRESADETKEIEITRDEIYIKSLHYELRDDDIFLIEINSFNEDTLELFNQAAFEIGKADPDGIILDLRSNPGGFLDTSVEIASEWIEEGVVVKEIFSSGKTDEYKARGNATLKAYPTVVLVNGGSASASEIVAGALQDHDLAEIVGEKTFGKGSVQVWKGFPDGSSVKITTAKWLTPSGTSINDEGITPDQEVEYRLEDFEAGIDPQFDKALEILKNN